MPQKIHRIFYTIAFWILAILWKDNEFRRNKIKDKRKRIFEVRTSGNANNNDIDKLLANEGIKRQADDIPKQDTKSKNGNLIKGNINNTFIPTTIETKSVYKISSATRPNIIHDKGFSNFPKREPTIDDYLALYKWTYMDALSQSRRVNTEHENSFIFVRLYNLKYFSLTRLR